MRKGGRITASHWRKCCKWKHTGVGMNQIRMKWSRLRAEILNFILELSSGVLFWCWHALFSPSWQSKFLVVDSRLFSHPLTGNLKRIRSPKLPNWEVAYSSKGQGQLLPHLHKLSRYMANSCMDKGPEAITTASCPCSGPGSSTTPSSGHPSGVQFWVFELKLCPSRAVFCQSKEAHSLINHLFFSVSHG